MFNSSSLSPADVIALNGNGNDGMGGSNGWWLILFILLVFCGGWNGGGYGRGAGGGVSENYTLISDMGQLERKIDGVYSGICDSTFALNNAVKDGFAGSTNVMTQGFAGLNTALVQNSYETKNAITQDTISNLQGFNGIQAAVKDCCCNTQSALKDVNYNIATQANGVTNAVNSGFCQTNFNNATNTRDIIEAQNAGTRAILEAINSNKVEALKDRIAEQNQQINALNLAASQQAQNNVILQGQMANTQAIIDKLSPCPKPSYIVANPNIPINYGCGCPCSAAI